MKTIKPKLTRYSPDDGGRAGRCVLSHGEQLLVPAQLVLGRPHRERVPEVFRGGDRVLLELHFAELAWNDIIIYNTLSPRFRLWKTLEVDRYVYYASLESISNESSLKC